MASEKTEVKTDEKKSSSWAWLDSALGAVKAVAESAVGLSEDYAVFSKNYKTAQDTLNGKTTMTVVKEYSIVPILIGGAIAIASILL